MIKIPVKKTLSIQILIADDSSQLRDRIKSLLNSRNNIYMGYEAENGEEALQLIREYDNEELKLLTELSFNQKYEDHEEKQHIEKSK